MRGTVKLATATAVSVSTVMTIICLSVVHRMHADITELYGEFMAEMKEFNTLTNDAWTAMMDMEQKKEAQAIIIKTTSPAAPIREKQAFGSFFVRPNRAVGLPSFCACSAPTNNACPAGPKGQPGTPGEQGQPGLPGQSGAPGVAGTAVGDSTTKEGCIQCPTGPAGPPGSPGPAGPPGPKGEDGPTGQPTFRGPKGSPGPQGDEGEGGHDGEPGERGPPGESGILGKPGPRGPKGANGQPGPPGMDGKSEDKAMDGEPGEVGEPGPDGLPGIPGPRGLNGQVGGVGFPGQDAQYCPCPNRATVIEAASVKGKDYNDPASVLASVMQGRAKVN